MGTRALTAPRQLGVGQIGESSPGIGTGASPKITPARLQQADETAYQRLQNDRKSRLDHIQYYVGRWYGREGDRAKPSKPLNLVAQQVHAFVPHLVPRYVPRIKPLRSGLEAEARKIQLLVDNAQREQDFREQVLEPGVIDAMFSPFATFYTSLRPGRSVLEIDGRDNDPGEPFTMFVEFDDVAVDPNAKDIRHALWFRHRYRVPRHWLLESPAFRGREDMILKLPAFEAAGDVEADRRVEGLSTAAKDRQDAMFDTIELLNFAIYDRGQIFEATLPPKERGPAEYLRFEEFVGPDDGPYDYLSFHRVPGNLLGQAPINVTRDIAEVGDDLANKIHDEAKRSKKLGGYKRGAVDDANAVADSADGAMVAMDDPNNVKVYDLSMVSADVVAILGSVGQQYQEAAGNPGLLGGTAEQSNTLGQDEILNQRAGVRVAFMGSKVISLIARITRKWAYYFQTDPIIDAQVAVPVEGVGNVDMRYSAMDRQGGPGDFTYEAQVVGQPATDPNLQARRIIEFMQVILSNAAAFLPTVPGIPPMFNLQGVVKTLAPMFGIDDPETIINDVQLTIDRMMAEQQADAWLAAANGQAPNLARPGVQAGAGQRMAGFMQQMMPVAGMQGLRQVGRPR